MHASQPRTPTRAIDFRENGALKNARCYAERARRLETWPANWQDCDALPGAPHTSKIHVARTINKRVSGHERVTRSQ